eukprot:2220565-Ditylum_brightwellii.AAC.1
MQTRIINSISVVFVVIVALVASAYRRIYGTTIMLYSARFTDPINLALSIDILKSEPPVFDFIDA